MTRRRRRLLNEETRRLDQQAGVERNTLAHITLNTDHCAPIPRAFVKQDTLDILGPLVKSGGGGLPNTPFEFSLFEHDGAATIDFRCVSNDIPIHVVVGTICERRSSEWWAHLLRTARAAGICREIAEPKSPPWLGVVILPTIAMVPISPFDLMTLGSLENSVAWAWLTKQIDQNTAGTLRREKGYLGSRKERR